LKIIKIHEMTSGDVIDFTLQESMYWNQRKPENKIQKINCPYCGRLARVDEYFEFYDHQLKIVDGENPDVFDSCLTPMKVCKEVQNIRQTVALNLKPNLKDFSEDALRIARLRGML